MTSSRMTASRLGNEEHGPKRQKAGRVCLEHECGTVLSIYNDTDFCFKHQPMSVPRTRGRKVA